MYNHENIQSALKNKDQTNASINLQIYPQQKFESFFNLNINPISDDQKVICCSKYFRGAKIRVPQTKNLIFPLHSFVNTLIEFIGYWSTNFLL